MKSMRYSVVAWLCLLFMMSFMGSSDSEGQDTLNLSDKNRFWIDGGLGACSGSTPVSLGLMLSSQTGTNLISLRYLYNTEIFNLFESPEETVQDIGALYGLILKKTTKSFVSISGGISYVRVVRRGELTNREFFGGEYEKLTYQTVGFALHEQVFWTPLPFFGVGLDIPASLNKERSIIAAQFSLQIGVLR